MPAAGNGTGAAGVRTATPPRGMPSFTAGSSALLGMLSLLAVLCFHFPELLT